MKICLIGPTYPFRGGISHYTTLLGRHLARRHQLLFLSPKRQYPKFLFPGKTDRDNSQVHIESHEAQKVLDPLNPLSWLKTARMAREYGPDLVIIPWWVSFWAPPFWTISFYLKMFAKTKILFLCHNVVEHESNLIDRLLTKAVLANGNSFLVHSQEDMENLLAINPMAKVKKSFHPTYDVFCNENNDFTDLKKELGVEGNIVLFFGFVREYKGLKYLLRALPEVFKKVDVTLLVVGEFWKDKDSYLKIIEELGLDDRVIFVDRYIANEDVGKYFSLADIVVQPYITATGSGIVQISFAFGRPVIATRVGCLPEIIKEGKTGYLVEPRDSAMIAEAIVRFFEEGKPAEFKKEIEQERAFFSWDKLIDDIEDLCE